MLHSCGNIYEIIPDLIELGLDLIHPIQPEVMDIYRLKKDFGKYISFQGGLRTQDLLPMGNPDDIKKEVKILKKEMGKGGGYILEPGITIQGDVPLDNLLAMLEEARR
jgi:uroporphyrinogen decarboxylase